MVLGQLYIHMQKNEVTLLHPTIQKINSKCITELHIITKIIALLENRYVVCDLRLRNIFLDKTPKAQVTR